MITGMSCFFISTMIDIPVTLYAIRWQPILAIECIIFGIAAILTAVSMVNILRYLLEEAKVDPLTGVYNRRHFKELLDTEVSRSARNHLQFTLLYCDVDHFKQINDKMGHTIGDLALRHVAQKLSGNVRASDVVARWGGDEFAILFPQTDICGVQTLIARLGEGMGTLLFDGKQLSISTGMAAFPDDGNTAEKLLSVADIRMYHNKKNQGFGGNQLFREQHGCSM
jgi:diguanylate cyclase (GGDEF)-like protein